MSTKASIKNLDDAEIWGAKIIFSIDEVSKREHDLALEQILIEGDASNVEVHIEDGTGFLSVKGQAEIIVHVIAQINSPMTLAKARELTYSLTIFSRS